MKTLVEEIVNENYIEANNLFESRLNDILESKLLERKKMVQAEVFGGLSKQDIAARKKAGYRKASEVLGDPRGEQKKSDFKKRLEKIEKEKVTKENIDEDLARDIAMGVKRTGVRAKVMGYAAQEVGSRLKRMANVGQYKLKKSVKKAIADPLPAAAKGVEKAAQVAASEPVKKAAGFVARDFLGSIG